MSSKPGAEEWEIRPYRREDEAQALTILRLGIQDQERFAEPVSDPENDSGFFRFAWEEQTQSLKDEPGNWWVSASGATVAGVMRLSFWKEESLGLVASVVELDVHPTVRQRGIGRALLAHAEALARSAGATMLFIGGFVANPALRLYRRAGFAESPESVRYNEGPDHLVLGKRLAPPR